MSRKNAIKIVAMKPLTRQVTTIGSAHKAKMTILLGNSITEKRTLFEKFAPNLSLYDTDCVFTKSAISSVMTSKSADEIISVIFKAMCKSVVTE